MSDKPKTERPDPDARAVLDASPDEVDRHLLAAGFDLDAEEAKADATYDAMVAKLKGVRVPDDRASGQDVAWVADDVPKVVSLESRRRSRAAWLVWAIAATVTAGGGIYAAAHRTEEPPREEPKPPPPAPAPSAAAPAPAPVPAPAPAPPSDKAPSDKAPSDKGPSRSDKAPH